MLRVILSSIFLSLVLVQPAFSSDWRTIDESEPIPFEIMGCDFRLELQENSKYFYPGSVNTQWVYFPITTWEDYSSLSFTYYRSSQQGLLDPALVSPITNVMNRLEDIYLGPNNDTSYPVLPRLRLHFNEGNTGFEGPLSLTLEFEGPQIQIPDALQSWVSITGNGKAKTRVELPLGAIQPQARCDVYSNAGPETETIEERVQMLEGTTARLNRYLSSFSRMLRNLMGDVAELQAEVFNKDSK